VAKKRAVAARLAGMRAAGHPVPRVRDLRIGGLACRSGWRRAAHEFMGAFRRARRGAFSEPIPDRGPEPRHADGVGSGDARDAGASDGRGG
jgi:hypothetical protein